MKKSWVVLPIAMSIVSLFLEQRVEATPFWLTIINLLDASVLVLLLSETVGAYRRAPYKSIHIRNNLAALLFTLMFTLLFTFSKYQTLLSVINPSGGTPSLSAVILKNTFLVLKILTRFRKLNAVLESISLKPAQTIVLSFLLVILAGTLLLMMPLTSSTEEGLTFLEALFTSTSAVCVTGLIVVDTATAFSFWGHLTIVILIQIGGLGIMILSYFSIFTLRKGVSREEKLLVAYMLSQDDLRSIRKSLTAIIGTTFGIEFVGALLLYSTSPGLTAPAGGGRIFAALFHAVSAFCNAGFALFSDSLESFVGNIPLNLVIALLIIAGGLSFGVYINLGAGLFGGRKRLTVNTRTVLTISGSLIVAGTFLFYALEHGGILRDLPTGRQYLAAFFQSVTLRTAGFNTVPLGSLTSASYLFMCLFMFIGGASGSTAGGIKVNSLAAIGAYFRSLLKETRQITIYRNSLSMELVLRAFTIVAFGAATVFLGSLILLMTEEAPPMQILFEAFSAFGTVGLSAGITGSLTTPGRLVIICMMFMGRIGPLTVLAAAGSRGNKLEIRYPSADISIG